jgi:transposase, IS30 family
VLHFILDLFERTNAILHKFIPKKTDFNTITDKQIIHANLKLNNLPKKCLNFLTPNEAWDNHYTTNVALDP